MRKKKWLNDEGNAWNESSNNTYDVLHNGSRR